MRLLRPSALLLLVLSLLTGLAYPLLVTGLAQAVFPNQANGSLTEHQGMVIGSELVGQQFDQPQWFWGRPSATAPQAYNATASGGSNLAPTNPALAQVVRERLDALRAAHGQESPPVPMELVTTSASGLDPHLSPAAVLYQVGRVAAARGLDPAQVAALARGHIEGRQWGVLGQPRVNVLKLNLALARRWPGQGSADAAR
ncbi:MAG: potassium-transporting ATPase subunit KdpC [Desulfarculus sp.]|nr:potassium-transporting ATPase subunit KdpC [Desulfarculus sp.]